MKNGGDVGGREIMAESGVGGSCMARACNYKCRALQFALAKLLARSPLPVEKDDDESKKLR